MGFKALQIQQGLKQSHPPHAAAVASRKNQVIEDREVDRFTGTSKLSRRLAIGAARPAIATWMIVGQHDPGAAETRGIDDDVPDGHADRLRLPFIAFDMNATGRLIDMSNPKPLPFGICTLEAGGKE